MKEQVNQEVVECVNAIIDRGTTRIKRNHFAERLINLLMIFADGEVIGKENVFDTMACRITVVAQKDAKAIISFEGNDELTSKLTINKTSDSISVNGNTVELQSLIVMVISLIMKNSQNSTGQFVEVFTKS